MHGPKEEALDVRVQHPSPVVVEAFVKRPLAHARPRCSPMHEAWGLRRPPQSCGVHQFGDPVVGGFAVPDVPRRNVRLSACRLASLRNTFRSLARPANRTFHPAADSVSAVASPNPEVAPEMSTHGLGLFELGSCEGRLCWSDFLPLYIWKPTHLQAVRR